MCSLFVMCSHWIEIPISLLTSQMWCGTVIQQKGKIWEKSRTIRIALLTILQSWQNTIDSGDDLPDLYIVQISFGSQGIVNGMWNPDKEKIMILGKLGEVDISLFPNTLQLLLSAALGPSYYNEKTKVCSKKLVF